MSNSIKIQLGWNFVVVSTIICYGVNMSTHLLGKKSRILSPKKDQVQVLIRNV
jgi:hypothetical protein